MYALRRLSTYGRAGLGCAPIVVQSRHYQWTRVLKEQSSPSPRRTGWDTVSHISRKQPTRVKLPNRGVLSVTGPGVGQFLDGLISGRMPDDTSRQHFYSVFLNAKGRILYDVFLYSNMQEDGKPGYFIEYDSRPSEAQPLLQMLKRHLLRSKIRIRDVSTEYDVWAKWDPEQLEDGLEKENRKWGYHSTGVIEPVYEDQDTGLWGAQPGPFLDRRAVGLGQRLLIGKDSSLGELDTYAEATVDEYRVHRYLNGVPEGIEDLAPVHAFPVNSSLDIMGALSFKKGCHVGQEHLSRARHVNLLRRRLLPVIIHREGESADDAWKTPKPIFPAETEVSTRLLKTTDGHQPASRVKNNLVSSIRGVGLAMLRTEDVDAWEDGHCVFEFEHPAEEGGEAVKWNVSPSKPSWWPDPRTGFGRADDS